MLVASSVADNELMTAADGVFVWKVTELLGVRLPPLQSLSMCLPVGVADRCYLQNVEGRRYCEPVGFEVWEGVGLVGCPCHCSRGFTWLAIFVQMVYSIWCSMGRM